MPAFFDSSVLLSILLNDDGADPAIQIWEENQDRVASSLMELECISVLRRSARQFSRSLPNTWLRDRKPELASYLEEVSLKPIDAEVVETVRHEDKLGSCRTLDAIHLGTALLFQRASEEPFVICTFDQRMAGACRLLGLQTLPQ